MSPRTPQKSESVIPSVEGTATPQKSEITGPSVVGMITPRYKTPGKKKGGSVSDCFAELDRYTEANLKPNNEDVITVNTFNDRNVVFAGVFDGHGSAGVSTLAAERMPGFFKEAFDEGKTPAEALQESYQRFESLINGEGEQRVARKLEDTFSLGNEEVEAELSKRDESFSSRMYGMVGSCAVTVAIVNEEHGRTLVCANVGDSVAYLIRGDRVIRLSTIHDLSNKRERARLADLPGGVIGNRVFGVLKVTRSLGDLSLRPGVLPEPAISITRLEEEDDFLIMVSDGVTDKMQPDAIAREVRNARARQPAKTLVEKAIALQTVDNVSAIVFKL
ncbi:hypothetical protein PCE1_003593 [Barthelona sp. PCE]